LCEMDTIWGLL
nr:immunoglobulin heavy chain junction region [Mus musculus]